MFLIHHWASENLPSHLAACFGLTTPLPRCFVAGFCPCRTCPWSFDEFCVFDDCKTVTTSSGVKTRPLTAGRFVFAITQGQDRVSETVRSPRHAHLFYVYMYVYTRQSMLAQTQVLRPVKTKLTSKEVSLEGDFLTL